MAIPEDIRIFSLIYEYHHWVLLPLVFVWAVIGLYFICRIKKIIFLWLLIFPLIIQPLQIAAVWSGWHYRMELRNRFAQARPGFYDSFTPAPINIKLMPPEIYKEYAKHNFSPRYRDIKALIAGTIVFTPVLYIIGGALYLLIAIFRGRKRPKQEIKENEV